MMIRLSKTAYVKAKLFFEKRDMWVGVFWTQNYPWLDIYICVLPCFPLRLSVYTTRLEEYLRRQ